MISPDMHQICLPPAHPRDQTKPTAAATPPPTDPAITGARTSSGRAQGVLKMEGVDVSRQLKQMTDFIRQEAVEKAVEIEAAAAEVSPPHPSSVHCLLEDFKGRIS